MDGSPAEDLQPLSHCALMLLHGAWNLFFSCCCLQLFCCDHAAAAMLAHADVVQF